MMQCLKPLTASIEIQELREVGCDWSGDLFGYYAIGHHDPVAFIQAVNAEHNPDCPVEAQQVHQGFWMEYPLEIDSDCYCFKTCNADIEGAIAVTYIEV
ncbi:MULTISPECIES: hypothetical protein [Acaryochloris]|uniref:hypothetical protein n=1 Tax=Acaryochloris TaxID=155977 RepID=UPI001F180EEB|nr:MULTISPECIES: hypothetical protein [Acaryochloris]